MILDDLVAVVLAAGLSRRTASVNKLTMLWHGRPLLAHVLDTVAESSIASTVVVTGPTYREALEPVLVNAPHAREVFNPDAAQGMGTSIAAGISAIAGGPCRGAFIVLGDMPFVTTNVLNHLAANLCDNVTVVRPSYDGIPGHPVLFGRQHFDRLCKLRGDAGASSIIKDLPAGSLREIVWPHDSVVRDFDRLEDFL